MRTWIDINEKALEQNLIELNRVIQKPMWIMVKSNAYGHGFEVIQKSNFKNQNDNSKFKIVGFGVSNGQEALELRKIEQESRIAIFADSSDVDLEILANNNIEISLNGFETLEKIKNYRGKRKIKAHLKIETGLNRYGFKLNELEKVRNAIAKLPIELVGIYSHFSSVEDGYTKFAEVQLERFLWGTKALDPKHKIPWHMAATAAAVNLPPSRLDQVRIGIGLYGLYPATIIKKRGIIKLQPVLSWKSKIISIHNVKVRDTVGYGNTFKVIKPLNVAVIPVGYADGYDRKLSNKNEVLISGQRCKILGRVFMNTIIADITRISHLRGGGALPLTGRDLLGGVTVGSEVVLVGKQGAEEITIDEIAKIIGTINYEVVTRINWQIPRVVA